MEISAMGKAIRDLTDEELVAEWKYWDEKIRSATGWGASLAAADEFRRQCESQIRLRGLMLPPGGPRCQAFA